MDADDAIFGNNEYPVFYFYDVVNGFSVKSYGKPLTQGDANAESSGNADTTSAGSDTSTDTSGADSQAGSDTGGFDGGGFDGGGFDGGGFDF